MFRFGSLYIQMKYWAFFAAKLAAVWAIATLIKRGVTLFIPVPASVTKFGHPPFMHDLSWTIAFMAYALFCAGLVYLAIIDQKYRCRTCLRRLRMPVNSGSWDRATIFAPPRTEYICPYGHGTMTEKDLQITGRENPDWVEHKDIWQELESIGRK